MTCSDALESFDPAPKNDRFASQCLDRSKQMTPGPRPGSNKELPLLILLCDNKIRDRWQHRRQEDGDVVKDEGRRQSWPDGRQGVSGEAPRHRSVGENRRSCYKQLRSLGSDSHLPRTQPGGRAQSEDLRGAHPW